MRLVRPISIDKGLHLSHDSSRGGNPPAFILEVTMAKLDSNGHEVLDPKPMALPVGYKTPEPIQSMIARLVRGELSRRASASGFETFEEAENFNVPDDMPDPTTPYEENFDPITPFVAAREAELRHGAVKDIPEERKREARSVWQRFKDKASQAKRSAAAAGDQPPAGVPAE